MPIDAVRLSPDDPLITGTAGNVGLLHAIPYPSPYFDLSQTYFPASIKELFQYCIYFYNTHCIIPAVVNKLAAYPITELVFAEQDEELRKKWKCLFIDELNIPFELFQAGIDMGVYGNSFIGVYFPFKRYLKCSECKSVNSFNSIKTLKVRGRKLDLSGECPSCKKIASFEILDKYIRNVKKIKLIRYDPMAIDIISDPVSGERTYLWDLPSAYRDAIRQGKDLDVFERAPKIVLEAVKEDKKIRLSNKNMYHMKRPSLAGMGQAWGFPLIMHALKSLYYLQVLKMAQEAIAIQHVIPLWVLFPSGGNGSDMPPAASINLNKWKSQIEKELGKWRKDRNYIPILNFPVGFEQIGGEGRALLLGPEVQQELQQVIASMAVPQEFVFGGMTWTGSSITLRMLENTFQGMRDGMQRFLRFLVSAFSRYLGYKQIDVYMSELKMADDVQRQQILMNLEATGKISTTRLLSELGFDVKEEDKLMGQEFPSKVMSSIRAAIVQARAQGEAGMESLKFQIKAQKKQMDAQNQMMGQAAANGQLVQDPQTGLMVDPNTGMYYDQSGQPVDPATGQLIAPEQAAAQDSAAMGLDQQAAGSAPLDQGGMTSGGLQPNAPVAGGPMPMPGQMDPAMAAEAQHAAMYGANPLQQANVPPSADELVMKNREQTAATAQASGMMPPDLKSFVTRYATSLLFSDQATQGQLMAQMQQEMPVLAQLVQRRMMELTQIDPAVAVPEPPTPEMPPGMKPTTVR